MIPVPDFHHPEQAALYGAWQRARSGAALPTRGNFSVARLGPLAEPLVVIQQNDRGEMRIVYSGQSSVERLQTDTVGMTLNMMFPPAIADRVEAFARRSVAHPCGGYMRYGPGDAGPKGQDDRAMSCLLLPVAHEASAPPRMFYALPMRDHDHSYADAGIDWTRNVRWMVMQTIDLGFGRPFMEDVIELEGGTERA